MKFRFAFARVICLIALIFHLPGSATAQSAGAYSQDTAWIISSIDGDVKVRSLDATDIQATAGLTLVDGMSVVTGEGSRLTLTRDKDRIIVSPNSSFEIGKGNQDNGGSSILQKLGTMLFSIDSSEGPRKFQVETPYLAAVIKGTMFSVSVTPEGSALHVTEGLVQVASVATGQTGLVAVGQTARVSARGNGALSIDRGDGRGSRPPADQEGSDDGTKEQGERANENANENAANSQGNGNQGNGNQGNGNQGNGNQGQGNRGQGNQVLGTQAQANRGARGLSLGNQGAGNRGLGNQGVGNQAMGNPGRGNQINRGGAKRANADLEKGNRDKDKSKPAKTNPALMIVDAIDAGIGNVAEFTRGLIEMDGPGQSGNASFGSGDTGTPTWAGNKKTTSIIKAKGNSGVGNGNGNGNGNGGVGGGNGNGNGGVGNGNGNGGVGGGNGNGGVGGGNGNGGVGGGNGNGGVGGGNGGVGGGNGNGNGNAGGNGNGNAGGNGNGNGNSGNG